MLDASVINRLRGCLAQVVTIREGLADGETVYFLEAVAEALEVDLYSAICLALGEAR